MLGINTFMMLRQFPLTATRSTDHLTIEFNTFASFRALAFYANYVPDNGDMFQILPFSGKGAPSVLDLSEGTCVALAQLPESQPSGRLLSAKWR